MTTEELNELIDHVLPQIREMSDNNGLYDVVTSLRREKSLSIQHGNVVRNKLVEEKLVERGTDEPKKVRILPFGTDILETHGTWSAYLSHKEATERKQEQLLRLEKKANAKRLAQEDARAERNLLLTEQSAKATKNSAIAAWGSAAATFFSVVVSVYGCYDNKADTLKRQSIDTLTAKVLKLERKIETLKSTPQGSKVDTSKVLQVPEKKVVKRKI